MFWNREKIEVFKNIPRDDATPLEGFLLARESFGKNYENLSISNIFFSLIIQLYEKKVIKIKKRDVCSIDFDFDNVDMFSSIYQKTITDYKDLQNVKPEFNSEIGYFYNELFKFTKNSEALAKELSLSLDELAMLNLLKVVAFENDGKITIELIFNTLKKRDYTAIRDVNIESIKFFFSKVLAESLCQKEFISEESKLLKLDEISVHTEKFLEESIKWKGFKKYIIDEFTEEIWEKTVSIKDIIKFLPYAIMFDFGFELIEELVSSQEGEYNREYEIVVAINSLSEEIEVLKNLENM